MKFMNQYTKLKIKKSHSLFWAMQPEAHIFLRPFDYSFSKLMRYACTIAGVSATPTMSTVIGSTVNVFRQKDVVLRRPAKKRHVL